MASLDGIALLRAALEDERNVVVERLFEHRSAAQYHCADEPKNWTVINRGPSGPRTYLKAKFGAWRLFAFDAVTAPTIEDLLFLNTVAVEKIFLDDILSIFGEL